MGVKAPQTILILRALQLGDLLCATPAFRTLRRAYPGARITLLGLPWARSFVQRFSIYLDDFIEFPGWPGLPEQVPQIERIPGFLQEVRERKFDLALQMQGSGGVTNVLIALLGARRVGGFYLPGQFQPDASTFPIYPEGEHEIRIWLRLMESLGIPGQGEHLELPIYPTEQASFAAFSHRHGLEPGSYVCLHPGARDVNRRWPAEKFAAVGDALAQRGCRVVLTGAEAERELTRAVAERMSMPVSDAAGQTDLGSLALLLAGARLLVCNDTGVSHVAAAVKTPSVILFNPTAADPQRWRPLDQTRHQVIENLDRATPQDVLAVVDRLPQEDANHAKRAA